MRGRRPKPTKLKVLAGNPGKRPLPEGEPQFSGIPQCPEWLTDEAKAIWADVVPELVTLGIVGRLDRMCLAIYCQTYARYMQAEAEIDKHGITIIERGRDGVILSYKKNPAVTVSIEAQKLIRSFAAEYGLTAASRTKIHGIALGRENEFDEFDRFMGGKPVTQ